MDLTKKQEQKRVDKVRALIQDRIDTLKQQSEAYKSQIVDIKKNFWDDVTINVDHADDIVETYFSIKQQAELLSERERNQKHIFMRLKNFTRLHESPYFGRIDFVEDGSGIKESIYIGIASLLDDREENFLIYDWRAPISSMYYDFGPGPASYEAPSGMIEGTIDLKRQYIIQDGMIQSLFDTTLTIGDELLQQVLGKSSDNQLKNIVATIQREQNQIIRGDKSRYLIVQGPAGSGKTSAALQRVAYLLYKYRETLGADQIILFSPNPMFNSYVSTVLPDLGEENMQQTTFQEYLRHRLSHDFDVEDPLEQMEMLLTADKTEDYKVRKENIQFKSTPEFMQMLHEYADILMKKGIVFRNLTFQGRVLISAVQMEQKFYQLQNKKLYDRIHDLAQWLIEELKRLEKIERKQDWVQENIQYLSDDDYQKVHNVIRKKSKQVKVSFDDGKMENKLLSSLVVKRHFSPLRKLIKKLRFVDVPAVYRNMFSDAIAKELAQTNTMPPAWKEICRQTMQRLDARELPYEDATPYLYLKELIEGVRTNKQIQHVILDEGQDYTPFQYEFLKRLFPRAKMTVLGDIHQAIFTSGAFYDAEKLGELFGEEQTEVIRFNRSYRSTRQIVEFTRSMLEDGHLIEPFHRDGPMPIVTKLDHVEAQIDHTIDTIHGWLDEGLTTVAVICKTENEARALWDHVQARENLRFKPQFISKHAVSFEKGILFIPSYLAKGMEFDAVLISDASAKQYGLDERKLLYTSCTRAMHALHVQSVGSVSPLLEEADAKTYISREYPE